MEDSFWIDQLMAIVRSRKVIVKSELLAQATPTVEMARRFGAADVLVLATTGVGTGPLPDAESVSLDTDVTGLSIDRAIHAGNRALDNLPAHAIEQLERFDPGHEAVVIGDFLTDSPALAGRPFLAFRRPEWLALDDKTAIDGFWDRAGVRRASYEIVGADATSVTAAFHRVASRDGAVIAVDATQGWTGGGEGTRPVRNVGDIAAALRGWEDRLVRITPFMEGVPCSIHGIVFPEDVVVLRPVELVILRKQKGDFFYCGCASFWDPPPSRREEMREVARRVGRQLLTEVDYRGAFTVDGVVTAEGFRPTELNPRNGAGLVTMSRASDFPLQLLLDAVVGGVPLDWRPSELEAFLLDTYDNERGGATWHSVDQAIPAGDYPLAGGSVVVGDSPIGAFVRAVVEHPVGQRFGPRAAEIWTWIDEKFGLGLGPMTASAEHL